MKSNGRDWDESVSFRSSQNASERVEAVSSAWTDSLSPYPLFMFEML